MARGKDGVHRAGIAATAGDVIALNAGCRARHRGHAAAEVECQPLPDTGRRDRGTVVDDERAGSQVHDRAGPRVDCPRAGTRIHVLQVDALHQRIRAAILEPTDVGARACTP